MQSANTKVISILPEELVFQDATQGTSYTKSLTIKNNIGATIEIMMKSSSTERLDVFPKTRSIGPFEAAAFEVKLKLTKAFPKRGRQVQSLKDLIYIKSNYFDMKVPVHILPVERSESMGPPIHSSLSPTKGKEFLKRVPSRDLELEPSLKPQFETHSERALELERELERTKEAIERKQVQFEEHLRKSSQEQLETQKLPGLPASEAESETLEKIKEILKEKHPSLEALMDVSLKQEREKHERQNEKVLQILKIKDSIIEELQEKNKELEDKYRMDLGTVEDIHTKYSNQSIELVSLKSREQQLLQTLAEHEETINLLNDNHEQMKEEMNRLQTETTDLSLLQKQYQDKSEESLISAEKIEKLSKDLQEATKRVNELKRREDFVIELSNRQEEVKNKFEEQLKIKDKQLEEIQQELEKKENILKNLHNEMKQNMESSNRDLGKYRNMEQEITALRKEKLELQQHINEVEEIYRNDNEKLAEIIDKGRGKLSATDRSFTVEDLKSSSRDIMGRLQQKISEQQREIEDQSTRRLELELKLKNANDLAAGQQKERANAISSYNEEISRLQNQLLEFEEKSRKISTSVKVQTAINGENLSELYSIVEDLREKLENEVLQRSEREGYVKQLEGEVQNKVKEIERLNSDFDAILKRQADIPSETDVSRQNELIGVLNSKISAFQIQLHQMQAKAERAENSLELAYKEFDKERQSFKAKGLEESKYKMEAISHNPLPDQKGISDHLNERLESQEIIIVQLREEVIQLEVEKRKIEQSLQQEIEIRNAKNKALESMLSKAGKSTPESSSQLSVLNLKVELEKLREYQKMTEIKIKKDEESVAELTRENVRLKQTDRLSQILPSDGEIVMKLTNKIKTQKIEIKQLQALLKRAKIEFDKVSSAMQAKQATELPRRLPTPPLEVPKTDIQKESEFFDKIQSELKLSNSERLLNEYKSKLQESLRVIMELKEEYSNKLMEREEKYQRQIHKLAEECRTKSRSCEVLEHKLVKLQYQIILEKGRSEEEFENYSKTSSVQSEKIRKLEDSLHSAKNKYEETSSQVQKHEIAIQERSAQISVLMETIETLQKSNKEMMAQRYLAANVELCSAKSLNSKLETRIIELETHQNKLKKELDYSDELNRKINDEKIALNAKISEFKQIIDLQGKEIEKLEDARDEAKMELASKLSEAHVFEEQLKAKEKRIQLYKVQLSEIQNRAVNITKPLVTPSRQFDKGIKSSTPSFTIMSLNAAPLNSSTKLIDANRFGNEDPKGEFRPIAVMLKQLLANVEKQCTESEMVGEFSPLAVLQRLSTIILQSEKIIYELERSKQDLEQQLSSIQRQTEEKVFYDRLLLQLESLNTENSSLKSLIETYYTSSDKLRVERVLTLEDALGVSHKSLYQSNIKILQLSEDNSRLKSLLQNSEDRSNSMHMEMQVTKARLEKELAMNRVKAEEELSLKLSLRNEEMKTYFDTHVAKLIIGKEGGSELMNLSRELCAQKLMVDKLEKQLLNSGKIKDAVETELKEVIKALEKANQRLYDVQMEEYQKYQKKAEEFAHPEKNINRFWSRKSLKVELDQKTEIIDKLNQALHESKQLIEQQKMKLLQVREKANSDSILKQQVEELEMKIISLNQNLEARYKDIDILEKRLSDLSSDHMLEMHNIQSEMELNVAEERKRIHNEYDILAKKYKPGEAPGEIIGENEELKNKCKLLSQHIEQLESESIILQQKLESIINDNIKLRDEVELYRKSLEEMQESVCMLMPGGVELGSTSKAHSRLGTPSDKRKEIKKRTFNAPTDRSIQISPTENSGSILKMPVFVNTLVNSKLNEADAEARVRKLGRIEIELRKEMTRKSQTIHGLESKLRHYERVMKDNNLPILDSEMNDKETETLRKRVIELEAICEDLKLKEAQAAAAYSIPQPIPQYEEIDSTTTELLMKGLICLCNNYCNMETQLKERKIGGSIASDASSTYYPTGPDFTSQASVERVQRIIIKSLTSLLRNSMGDSMWNLQAMLPSSETDRQVWYLDLLELQTQQVEKAISQLKDYTSKVTIEITGSLAAAAQIKAAAFELANQTKESAEELANLKFICGLVKKDLEEIGGKEANPMLGSFKSTPMHFDLKNTPAEIVQLTDRLALAEKIKKNLENELVQLKIALSYNQSEGSHHAETTKVELDKQMRQNKQLQHEIEELKKELECEKYTSSDLKNELQKNIKQINSLNDQLTKKNRQVQASEKMAEELLGKERRVLELEEQIKIQKESIERINKDNQNLKSKCNLYDKQAEAIHSEGLKALQKENKELDDRLKREIEERRKEIELWIKERTQLRQIIEHLRAEQAQTLKLQESSIMSQHKLPKDIASDSEKLPHSKKTDTHHHKSNRRHREQLKKLQEELQEKQNTLFKLQSDLQEANSKIHIAELNTEEERRKVLSVASELREAHSQIRENENMISIMKVSADEGIRKESLEMKATMDAMKQEQDNMEQQMFELKKRVEELKQERDKMVIVIQELDIEQKLKQKEFEADRVAFKGVLDEKMSQLKEKEESLVQEQAARERYTNAIQVYQEELNNIKDQFDGLRNNNNKLEKTHQELKSVVSSQEEIISKLKLDLARQEEEAKQSIESLKAEYAETHQSSEDLVSQYELQLKLIKERFKADYLELQNKLTVQSQTKGEKHPMSPKKKEQAELSVDLMFQLSQKDSIIKNLERTIGKLKNNALNSKAKLDKLQLQVKDQNVETGRKKTTERGTKRKTVKATPPEETVPASIYTKLMKERDEMEARVAKMQTQVKSLELRLSQEREMRTEAEQKAEEVMHEIEEMKGLVKAGKKEHGELSKKHKTELQKVLEELNNVRNNWRSPEELEKCIEEKHNVEIELKQAREEIARKNMVLKQWKEKEDLKQSETEQMLSEIESIKDDSEKLKKALKDLGRKDATIKNQKASLDQLKISEKQLSEENKLLVEKIKTMKAEIGRKDVSLRALREKSDESKIEKEDVKGRDIEIDKFKQKWLAVKQEAERKEEQIKLLRSKLENLMNDLENSKATQDTRNKNDLNEIEKVQKKYEQLRVKLRTTESKLQQMSIMIRTLFREMLTDIEKLRSRSHAVHKGMMQAHKASVSGDSAEYKLYAESLNILGIGEDDMGEFLGGQPRKSPTAIPDYSNDDLVELVAKINRLVESQEKPSDYDEIIEKYKELLKEKSDMEKFLNTLLKEQPSEAKPEERKGVSLDKYERYGRSIEDELAPQKHKSIK